MIDTRLAFFEMLLYWQGYCSIKQLEQQFNISREHLRKDIKLYRSLYPDNLANERSPYQISQVFKAGYSNLSQMVYFDWLCSGLFVHNQSNLNPEWFSRTQTFGTKIDPLMLRPIVYALQNKKRLDIDYESLTSSSGEGRIIQPHSLVRTSQRYHLRAYCEKNKNFRDFVVTRIKGNPEILDDADKFFFNDELWQKIVTVILVPDMRLNKEQRQTLEVDYQMKDGCLRLEVRAAMLKYTLDDWNIDYQMLAPRALAQQLMIANYDDIKEWIFN